MCTLTTVSLVLALITLGVLEGRIIPKRLQAGDTVGFISPASPPYYIYNASTYKQHVIDTLATLSLKVKFGQYAFVEDGYLAGTDLQRASDVMSMFLDDQVQGIIANRGGWGCNRLINLLDYDAITQNPKILMGYSDLTGLLNAVHEKTGLVTFHGPMGIDRWVDTLNIAGVQQVLLEGKSITMTTANYTTLVAGKASGRLIGGNLSVFSAIVGSPYFPSISEGSILFIEEVEEAPYRIDRMLTQLSIAGVLDKVSGIVFGSFTKCDPPPPENQGFTLLQVLRQKVGQLACPSFYGARFGHIDEQYTLPIGTMITMDADAGTITMLEPAVE